MEKKIADFEKFTFTDDDEDCFKKNMSQIINRFNSGWEIFEKSSFPVYNRYAIRYTFILVLKK